MEGPDMKNLSTAPTRAKAPLVNLLDDLYIVGQRDNNLPVICRRAIEHNISADALVRILSDYSDSHGHADKLAGSKIEQTYNKVYGTDAPARPPRVAVNQAAMCTLLQDSDVSVFKAPGRGGSGILQTNAFLDSLYRGEDLLFIGDTHQVFPASFRTTGEWLSEAHNLKMVRRTHFCINPLTPGVVSRTDANVSSFRYFLIEADPDGQCVPKTAEQIIADSTDPRHSQLKLLAGLIEKGLPIVSVAYSGNKSFHALVAISGIHTLEQWKTEIKGLVYPVLKAMGLDGAVSNPSRLSRLPGSKRQSDGTTATELYQDLIYCNPAAVPMTAKEIAALLSPLAITETIATPMASGKPTPVRDSFLNRKAAHVTAGLIAEMLADLGVVVQQNAFSKALMIDGLDRLPIRPGADPKKASSEPTISTTRIRDNLLEWIGGVRSVSSNDCDRAYVEWLTTIPVYNPFLDRLDTLQWDGHDYLADVYQLIGIGDDKFSQYFMLTWFFSAISMADNDGSRNADLIPILKGPQGCGKSTLINNLCPDEQWYGTSSIDPDSKDSIMKATSQWITELGEISSTTKHDVEGLKRFLSDYTDIYRDPYGRETYKHPRRTVFIGTTNEDRYLVDAENRRFITIPMTGGGYEGMENPAITREIRAFRKHAWQFWAQVSHLYKEQGPDAAHVDALMEIDGMFVGQYRRIKNAEVTRDVPFEQNIYDTYNFATERSLWTFRTATDIGLELGPSAKVNDIRALGKALTVVTERINGEIKTVRGSRLYLLPPYVSRDCIQKGWGSGINTGGRPTR